MKRWVILAIAMALIVVAAHSEVRRSYYDRITSISDSCVVVAADTAAMPLAFEARFLLGEAEHGIELLWNRTDSANYDAISVRGRKDSNVSFSGRPMLEFRYHHVVGGKDSAEKVAEIEMDYPLNKREHTLALEADGEHTILLYGAGMPEEIAELAVSLAGDFGIAADGTINLSLVAVDCDVDNVREEYLMPISAEELASLLSAVKRGGSPAGEWEFLDRDTDSRMAMAGGRYRLLIVDRGGYYDIIYLEGAETGRDFWKPGMLKGRLMPTRFVGHYDLEWRDAEGRIIDKDANARVEQDAILTLSFPLLNSSLRFSQVR